jgi:hypothetical protein
LIWPEQASRNLGPAWTLNIRALNTLRGGEIYVYSCLYELFDLSLKPSSLSGGNEGVERCGIEALSAGRASWNKMKRQGKGASRRNNSHRAPCSVRGRGHEQNSTKAKASRVLLDSKTGGSGDLPPIVKKSFQEGCYSPYTGMQIMIEQFIVMEIVVKEEVVSIRVLLSFSMKTDLMIA